MSQDGSTIAIGATGNAGNGQNAGHVRVFKYVQTVSTTAVTALENYTIFPNPTTAQISIMGGDYDSITISDYLGKVIFTSVHDDSKIDLSELAGGVYFVKISVKEKSIIRKIIKL